MKSRRIGLFSGTFDPIHVGHVEVCLVALGACGLDEVLVMIEKNPHRKEKVTDYAHRKKMTELVLADFTAIQQFESAYDNITFENTLPELNDTYNKADFCLIIGSDMLEHLADWPAADVWLPQLELCVVLRTNQEKSNATKRIKSLNIKNYKILPAVLSPVSSSVVKKEIATKGYSERLHQAVMNYIKRHGLYRS